MKKDNFKYKLGERVFLLGKTGLCIVSGRGKMEYISGGTLNNYQVSGAHNGDVPEYHLLSEKDGMDLYK